MDNQSDRIHLAGHSINLCSESIMEENAEEATACVVRDERVEAAYICGMFQVS